MSLFRRVRRWAVNVVPALRCRGRVLDLQHRHVSTVAAPPLEQPSGGRAVLRGGDELQERVADREDRVAQPEVAHRGVGERLFQAKLRTQQLYRAIEVADSDHGLAQARHRPSVAESGGERRRAGGELEVVSRAGDMWPPGSGETGQGATIGVSRHHGRPGRRIGDRGVVQHTAEGFPEH